MQTTHNVKEQLHALSSYFELTLPGLISVLDWQKKNQIVIIYLALFVL